MNNTILIGFTGPSGSGKTTLAKWLSQENFGDNVEIHYFEGSASLTHTEAQRKYLTETYGYEPKGHQNVINLSSQNPDFGYDFQKLLALGREERINDYLNGLDDDGKLHIVITDRTFIDIMVYTSLQCGHNLSQKQHLDILNSCEQKQKSLFDLTIVVAPNENWTEDNGSRVSNNTYQNTVVMPVVDYFGRKLSEYYERKPNTRFWNNPIHRLWEWDLDKRKNQVLSLVNNVLNNNPTPIQRDEDAANK